MLPSKFTSSAGCKPPAQTLKSPTSTIGPKDDRNPFKIFQECCGHVVLQRHVPRTSGKSLAGSPSDPKGSREGFCLDCCGVSNRGGWKKTIIWQKNENFIGHMGISVRVFAVVSLPDTAVPRGSMCDFSSFDSCFIRKVDVRFTMSSPPKQFQCRFRANAFNISGRNHRSVEPPTSAQCLPLWGNGFWLCQFGGRRMNGEASCRMLEIDQENEPCSRAVCSQTNCKYLPFFLEVAVNVTFGQSRGPFPFCVSSLASLLGLQCLDGFKKMESHATANTSTHIWNNNSTKPR